MPRTTKLHVQEDFWLCFGLRLVLNPESPESILAIVKKPKHARNAEIFSKGLEFVRELLFIVLPYAHKSETAEPRGLGFWV